jgi:outer membrane immunogenic protein
MRISCTAVFIGATLTALTTMPGLAADMMMTKAPPPVSAAPAPTWTGFYVGGNVGYGWVDPTASFTANPEPAGGGLAGLLQSGPPVDFTMASAIGGGQLGYNWQVDRQWLVGFEADFDFGNLKGGGAANTLTSIHQPMTSTADERVDWFSTIRGRLGFLPVNNLLLYGTGGVAIARLKQDVAYNNDGIGAPADQDGNCAPGPGACYAGTSSRTAVGWVAGGGLEYAFADHWAVRAEYLYLGFGDNDFTESVPFTNTPGIPASTINVHYTPTIIQTVRTGLNYRF